MGIEPVTTSCLVVVLATKLLGRSGKKMPVSLGFGGFAPRFHRVAESPGGAAAAHAPSVCE